VVSLQLGILLRVVSRQLVILLRVVSRQLVILLPDRLLTRRSSLPQLLNLLLLIQLLTLLGGQQTPRPRRVRHQLPIRWQRLLRLIQGQLRQTQWLMHHRHLTIQLLVNIL
tara:strand:- start:367 stop:699 length:333 start_codon:yes stop_codon:yes gene_type:complete